MNELAKYRDECAKAVLAGLVSAHPKSPFSRPLTTTADVAELAFDIAEAMLVERARRTGSIVK